ncbi:NAD(P)-dependent oxidoreductase [Pseudaminobacter sp. 19-2017]|uniref:NAD(P)-dependent oxidoreductase n=1 Tax=Pseudaminobacter soli (ex Zhang et al. 2022) TaxID=2831468 RepID=A0A942E3J2_9HYPH|nr:NAD(P)-dependent oxidoreductase [Pseudaminobacter soli]
MAFVGLGMMGMPMASRLVAAGFGVRGSDVSQAALATFSASGGIACATPAEAAKDSSVLITMLPNGPVVRDVLMGSGRAADALAPGALVIDMSSSAPLETRRLAEELTAKGLQFVDAPVSGGVKRAEAGTLAIMAGGDHGEIERARPVLEAMGSSIVATGPVGSGHAVKALNNYVSAAGLVAACEAVVVAERFGVDPDVLIDVLNVSTGRNNSTEVKMKPFVLSGSFASGFAMALMAKDLRTAADLSHELGLDLDGLRAAAGLWTAASAELGQKADHMEIHRFVLERSKAEKGG